MLQNLWNITFKLPFSQKRGHFSLLHPSFGSRVIAAIVIPPIFVSPSLCTCCLCPCFIIQIREALLYNWYKRNVFSCCTTCTACHISDSIYWCDSVYGYKCGEGIQPPHCPHPASISGTVYSQGCLINTYEPQSFGFLHLIAKL